jgi:hypothetical protein
MAVCDTVDSQEDLLAKAISEWEGAQYLFAAQHGTGDRWLTDKVLFLTSPTLAYGNPVTVRGSDGKTYTNSYYGRDYVQLTWEANYRNMSHITWPAASARPPTRYRWPSEDDVVPSPQIRVDWSAANGYLWF